MDVICMTCKKTFKIDAKDSQYMKLKRGQTKLYVCVNCNRNIQGEASRITNINPSDFDPHDKALKHK